MKIEIKKKRMQLLEEVVETIELPKLPYYYHNYSTKEVVRVLPVFNYDSDGVMTTDEEDIYALDITIIPNQLGSHELKMQRFRISISNFSEIYARNTGIAWYILNDIIQYDNHYERTEEEFNKEMEVAVFRITEPTCDEAKEKHAGHP